MKEDVLVYGVGYFLKKNEEMVSAKYDINAFIDREKNGEIYKGKNIISVNEIKDYHFAKIVIMIQDLNECHKIKEMLVGNQGIHESRVVIWNEIFEEYYGNLRDRYNDAVRLLFWMKGSKEPEEYDYYSVSSIFMNQVIVENKLLNKTLLSVGGRVRYLVTMLPMLKKCIHSTMVPIEDFEEINLLFTHDKIVERAGDFYELNNEMESMDEVEILISHATIHCMGDTRYGNTNERQNDRIYGFAQFVAGLCKNLKHIIVSVPVNERENLANNASWLNDKKFINSFEENGYKLKKAIYDKRCLRDNDYNEGERITSYFPCEYCKNHKYVVGTYYFQKQ